MKCIKCFNNCFCFSLKTGAYFIVLITLSLSAASLLLAIKETFFNAFASKGALLARWVLISILVINAVVSSLLLYGLCTDKLWTMLLYAIANFVMAGFWLMVIFYFALGNYALTGVPLNRAVEAFFILLFTLYGGLEVYSLYHNIKYPEQPEEMEPKPHTSRV